MIIISNTVYTCEGEGGLSRQAMLLQWQTDSVEIVLLSRPQGKKVSKVHK